MEAESLTSDNNGSVTKSPLLEGWKRGGSGRRGRLSRRNSVNSLRNYFMSRLPDKVRSAVDPESPSHVDLSRAQGLSEGICNLALCDICVFLILSVCVFVCLLLV